jgi:hypothetical protein
MHDMGDHDLDEIETTEAEALTMFAEGEPVRLLKHPKRPRAVNQLAAAIVGGVTADAEPDPTQPRRRRRN